jgi:hypothetical protein
MNIYTTSVRETFFTLQRINLDAMSMTTFSAQVPEDSGLVDEFEEFRREKGMNKSEAVRALMRQSLERERNDDAQPPAAPSRSSNDWIKGNEGLLLGLAFLIGSDGILNSLQAVAGDGVGSLLYATLGLIVILSLLPMLLSHARRLIDRDGDGNGDDPTGAAGAS